MKITDRDKLIKEFLNTVIIADTYTISILFFEGKLRAAQKRLKILVDNKYIKCFRETVIDQHMYYSKNKPANWKHKILFSRFLATLKENDIKILKYKTPFSIGNIIADGFIAINSNINKIYFIEVELTKYFDSKKYIDLYYSRAWKEKFPVFPDIIVITDKKVNFDSELNVIVIDTKLSNIKKIKG